MLIVSHITSKVFLEVAHFLSKTNNQELYLTFALSITYKKYFCKMNMMQGIFKLM